MNRFSFLVGGLLIAAAGCDTSFQPNGPYERSFVAYSILNSGSDTQYVRLSMTYPPETDTSRVPDNLNSVTVSNTALTFEFHPHSIDSASKQWALYRAAPFTLEQGEPYDLVVTFSDGQQITSSTTSLWRGDLFLLDPAILWNPHAASAISMLITLGQTTRAYFVSLFIHYDVLEGGLWRPMRTEVPIAFLNGDPGSEANYVFPRPISRGDRSTGLDGLERIGFPTDVYGAIITKLNSQNPGGTLRYRRADFILVQMDGILYGYYNTVNRFPDSGSLRLDEPDYTNIAGGAGLFSTIAEERDTVSLPPVISY